MHIIQQKIGLPKIDIQSKKDNQAVFVIGPLPSGYGMTLGNALRRVLLSSLPGAAITSIKVEGASHEYSTLTGVKDSVLDIILNLKGVKLKKHSKDSEEVSISISKEGTVKASDIKCSSDIEILNPDHVITSITGKSVKFNAKMTVEKGVGYVPATLKKDKSDIGMIQVDGIFSPVTRVRYEVTNTRVGKMTDLDQLMIEMETNGSITPEDALKFAASILGSYFELLVDQKQVEPDFRSDAKDVIATEQQAKQEEDQVRESYTPVEICNLTPRTLNALINGGIGSIEQLVKCTPAKLSNLRGFGKKAMTEVADALAKRGLKMKEDDTPL